MKSLLFTVFFMAASAEANTQACAPERINSADDADRCFVLTSDARAQLQAIRRSHVSDIEKGEKAKQLAARYPHDLYLQALGAIYYSDAGQVMNADEEAKRRQQTAKTLARILESGKNLPNFVARLVEFEYYYNSRLSEALYLFGLKTLRESQTRIGNLAVAIGAGELGYEHLLAGDREGAHRYAARSLEALKNLDRSYTAEYYSLAVALSGDGIRAGQLLESSIKADPFAKEHRYWFDVYAERIQRIQSFYAADEKAKLLGSIAGLESLRAHIPLVSLKASAAVEQDTYEGCKREFSKLKSHFLDFTYRSDGYRVHGILALPEGFNPEKKYPTILYNRGGNREFGAITACNFKGMELDYVSQGYIVVATQYRGVMGGEGQDEVGGKDINDVLNLERNVLRWPFVDNERLFMVGGSRGGLMTLKALAAGSQVKAALVLSGVTDMTAAVKHRPDYEYNVLAEVVPAYWQNREAALKERSPIAWVERINAPLLMIHGSKDWRAPLEPVIQMQKALEKQGKPSRLIIHEASGHDLAAEKERLRGDIKDWLEGGYKQAGKNR